MKALKNVYKRPAFDLPPIECGEYLDHRNGCEYSLRYIPRSAKHTGKFGLYFHDKDAGRILIAVFTPGNPDPEHLLKDYPIPLLSILDQLQPACAWCGRDLHGDVNIHPKCKERAK